MLKFLNPSDIPNPQAQTLKASSAFVSIRQMSSAFALPGTANFWALLRELVQVTMVRKPCEFLHTPMIIT